MKKVHSVGPLTLRIEYLRATNAFLTLQACGQIVAEQPPLAGALEAVLGARLKAMQREIRREADHLEARIVPEYILVMVLATNFHSMWKAVVAPRGRNELGAGQPCHRNGTWARSIELLSEQASIAHQRALTLTDDLEFLRDSVDMQHGQLAHALRGVLNQLGPRARAESERIDALMFVIMDNIENIVAGANRVGGGGTDLAVGVLTEIRRAGSHGPKGLDPDGNSGESAGRAVNGGWPAAVVPLNSFSVRALEPTSDGSDETAHERASLAISNRDIAGAYQRLARVDALAAVTKVVAVQTRMFAAALKQAHTSCAQLAAGWGPSPRPSAGNGLALELANFARRIDALSDPTEVTKLRVIVERAGTAWDLFGEQLRYLKRAMGEGPSLRNPWGPVPF